MSKTQSKLKTEKIKLKVKVKPLFIHGNNVHIIGSGFNLFYYPVKL